MNQRTYDTLRAYRRHRVWEDRLEYDLYDLIQSGLSTADAQSVHDELHREKQWWRFVNFKFLRGLQRTHPRGFTTAQAMEYYTKNHRVLFQKRRGIDIMNCTDFYWSDMSARNSLSRGALLGVLQRTSRGHYKFLVKV